MAWAIFPVPINAILPKTGVLVSSVLVLDDDADEEANNRQAEVVVLRTEIGVLLHRDDCSSTRWEAVVREDSMIMVVVLTTSLSNGGQRKKERFNVSKRQADAERCVKSKTKRSDGKRKGRSEQNEITQQ
eukprot:scaffold16935_cov185-Amphora_coffeaeformis.AAC.2